MYKYKSIQIGQLSRKHLSFFENLLNFIITKFLKEDVDDDISFVWINIAPLTSITGDIKVYHQEVMTLLPPMEKCPMDFIKELPL